MTFPIQDVSPVLMAFPGDVDHLLPPEDAEVDFAVERRWGRLLTGVFMAPEMFGIDPTKLQLYPRGGVDAEKAWRHLNCVMGTYSIKHERKMQAAHYLVDQWFLGWGYPADEQADWMQEIRAMHDFSEEDLQQFPDLVAAETESDD